MPPLSALFRHCSRIAQRRPDSTRPRAYPRFRTCPVPKPSRTSRTVRQANLDAELATRLRAFFRYQNSNTQLSDWHELLERMSPALRGAVALQMNALWIEVRTQYTVRCFDTVLDTLFDSAVTVRPAVSGLYMYKPFLLWVA